MLFLMLYVENATLRDRDYFSLRTRRVRKEKESLSRRVYKTQIQIYFWSVLFIPRILRNAFFVN